MFKSLVFLVCICFSYSAVIAITSPNDVNKVYNEILNGKAPTTVSYSLITNITTYNPKIRPIGLPDSINVDEKGALIIRVSFSLRQIVTLDEKNQLLTSSFYLLLNWNDPRLMWNKTVYNNVDSIVAGASAFWLPDMAIINSGSASNLITLPSNQNIIITSEGFVYLTLSLPAQQTRCRLNVYNYPFDTQNCSIIIGSWMNNIFEFNFEVETNLTYSNTNNYIRHPIWELKSFEYKDLFDTSRFDIANDDLKNYDMSLVANDIGYYLILKRNSLYIMINGIFPCLVLNCVILIAFSLPFNSQVGLC